MIPRHSNVRKTARLPWSHEKRNYSILISVSLRRSTEVPINVGQINRWVKEWTSPLLNLKGCFTLAQYFLSYLSHLVSFHPTSLVLRDGKLPVDYVLSSVQECTLVVGSTAIFLNSPFLVGHLQFRCSKFHWVIGIWGLWVIVTGKGTWSLCIRTDSALLNQVNMRACGAGSCAGEEV